MGTLQNTPVRDMFITVVAYDEGKHRPLFSIYNPSLWLHSQMHHGLKDNLLDLTQGCIGTLDTHKGNILVFLDLPPNLFLFG